MDATGSGNGDAKESGSEDRAPGNDPRGHDPPGDGATTGAEDSGEMGPSGASALGTQGAQGAEASEGPSNGVKRLYLVPNSHYDVVWSFDREDYLQINERILSKAMRMVREEDFRFLVEQTYLLEQIEQRYPRLFSHIRDAVRDGTVEIADGQYLMPDTMLPHGEVLVREILHGKRYARHRLGVDVPVAWAADGFGFNAQLPQIYLKAGYRWLAFRRGIPQWLGSKVSEFAWEGLDGSTILAHWMPMGYRAGLFLDQWEDAVARLSSLAVTDHVLMPCGSGSTPPQPETQATIDAWNRTHEDSQVILATPSQFFEALDDALEGQADQLERHQGELYRPDLENVFQDVVTSRIGLKQAIRDAESLLLTTERASTLAWLEGLAYPHIALRDAWKGTLFNAFHDVISGCSIDEVYDDAWAHIEHMKEELPALRREAMGHLVDDDTIGSAIVVFNPNGWEATDWVEVTIQVGDDQVGPPGLALDGQPVPTEVVDVNRWDDGSLRQVRLGFIATVPATGTRTYEVTRARPEFPPRAQVSRSVGERGVNDVEVRTPHYRVTVEGSTGVLRVHDPAGSLLVEGNEIVLHEEHGDLYFQHDPVGRPIGSETAPDAPESGHGFRFGAFLPEHVEVETGPLRTVVRFKTAFYCIRWPYRTLGKSDVIIHRQKTLDVVKEVRIYNDLERIDLRTEMDSRHPHLRVLARFDTGLDDPTFTRETQFGALEIGVANGHRLAVGETVKVPSQTWLDAADGKGRGVALFTRGAPLSEVRGSEAFLTFLRSVSVIAADGKSGPFIPVPDAMEMGHHTYDYAVLPHGGDWREAGVHRQGQQFVQPLVAAQVDTDPRDKATRGFELSPSNLVLSTIKRAEDADDRLILRFYEATGRACRAAIELPAPVERFASAEIVNLLETNDAYAVADAGAGPGAAAAGDEDDGGRGGDGAAPFAARGNPVGPVAIEEGRIELDVSPFEIVTLRLTLDAPPT